MVFRNPLSLSPLSLRNISDLLTYPSGEETKVQPGKECAWGHTARAASLIPRFLTAAGAGAAVPEDSWLPSRTRATDGAKRNRKQNRDWKSVERKLQNTLKCKLLLASHILSIKTFQEFLNFSSISYILRNPTACLVESILRYVRRQY